MRIHFTRDHAKAEIAVPRILPRQRAIVWLRQFLANGRQFSHDVFTDGLSDGFSSVTLRRAKVALGIRSKKVRIDGVWHWYWALPPDLDLYKLAKNDDESLLNRLIRSREALTGERLGDNIRQLLRDALANRKKPEVESTQSA